jgi:signal transduction histidine kinase
MTGYPRTRRRWQLPPLVGDALVTALITVLTVLGSIGEAHPIQPTHRVFNGYVTPAPPWPAYLLVAAASLVLFWRNRYPVRVLAFSVVATTAYSALGYVNGAVLIAPFVALYAVAVALPARRAALVAAATLVVLATTTAAANPFGTFGGSFVLLPPLIAVVLFAGIAVRNRRAYVAALAARAEEAERTREEEARRRVDAERLRIARELHDVVAHTMATINVQAGVAAHVIPDLPEPAEAALRAIKEASKRGLRELRTILAVLRQADEAEPTQPAAGLAALDVLVSTAAAAGLPTQVHIDGVRRPLPAPVDLAAYRIIQESLTNAIRHAAPATATIRLDFTEEHINIEVTDTGHGPSDNGDGGGHGLIGMRERATAIGGTVQAGPAAHGGFRVLARLPTATP